MSERISVALGDAIRVKHGFAFSGSQFSEDLSYPTILTPGNFAIGGGFREARHKTFTGLVPAEYELHADDLIVTMTDLSKEGDTLGLPALIPTSGKYLHNQRIGLVEIVNAHLVDKSFLNFYLRTNRYRAYVLGTATGSTVRHTSPSRIQAFKASLPPVVEQRAIANVLGALEDKIIDNTRVVISAWALAKAEFDRLIGSARIPTTVGEVLTLEYGKPLPATDRIAGHVDVFGSGGIVGSHNKAFASGPGVVVGRKGTAGAVHWAANDYYPIDTTFCVAPERIEAHSMIFCYFLLNSLRLSDQNSDSAVPGLNRNEAHAIRTSLPDPESCRRFTTTTMPLIHLAGQADRESSKLAATRDALLPQLMSGKLRVRDAEKVLEGVL